MSNAKKILAANTVYDDAKKIKAAKKKNRCAVEKIKP